jgi:hypothetical protein
MAKVLENPQVFLFGTMYFEERMILILNAEDETRLVLKNKKNN